MSRDEIKKIIYEIFDYINGTLEYDKDYNCILGHPALFFFHSKTELDDQISRFILSKDNFDRFDIYYFVNKMIKFMLGPNDSHTKVIMLSKQLPIRFKFIDGKVYITDITVSMEEARYCELNAVNGVDIKTLISEIENITCYSTEEYLEIEIQTALNTPNILKSLPSFSRSASKITYTVISEGVKKDFTFDLDKIDEYPLYNLKTKPNYTYEIKDGVLIIVYNACKDVNAMKIFVEKLNAILKTSPITKFVVDLRGNIGGDSQVIKPLIEFLKDKEVVTLIDEYVFSSGRMACIDLFKIGSYFIGTNISTTLNAFGNNPRQLILNDLGLKVSRSTKYFYYDDNLNCHSYDKSNFVATFKNREYFSSLDPLIFKPDKLVYRTLEDYKTGADVQMQAALDYLLSHDKKKKIVS